MKKTVSMLTQRDAKRRIELNRLEIDDGKPSYPLSHTGFLWVLMYWVLWIVFVVSMIFFASFMAGSFYFLIFLPGKLEGASASSLVAALTAMPGIIAYHYARRMKEKKSLNSPPSSRAGSPRYESDETIEKEIDLR